MDELKDLRSAKVLLDAKVEELTKLKLDIHCAKDSLTEMVKKHVYDTQRDKFLQQHHHYTEKHSLNVTREWYYDVDWYKYTYGSRRSHCDEYGRERPYEGPNQQVFIVCDKCNLSCTKYNSKGDENEEKEKADFDAILLEKCYFSVLESL
jgi:hypothetical protein